MLNEEYKKFSAVQEHAIARYLEWDVVSGSGARLQKGDVISEAFLGECKTHIHPGHKISFKSEVWSKLFNEATSCFRWPVLFVDDGSQSIASTWCMVSPKLSLWGNRWTSRPFPTKCIASSITFDNADMWKHYLEASQVSSDPDTSPVLVFLASFKNNEPVGIMPLVSFAEIYRGK